MKVTHLYHSGCLVELEEHLLLFDYYQGELHLNQEKPLYVFVSHRHYDHYNPNIFKIHHPQITYILSNTLRHKYDAYYVDPKCTEKKIYLTFDCGYENGFTPKILDVLKRQKVVAAFFCNKTIYQRGSKTCKAYEKRRAYRRKSHGAS